MVNTVEKICLFFYTGLGCGRFAWYSFIASIELLQKGSTLLSLGTLFPDFYCWILWIKQYFEFKVRTVKSNYITTNSGASWKAKKEQINKNS